MHVATRAQLELISHSSNAGDDGLWEKVNEKLEKLTPKCVDIVPVDNLDKIQKHCRNLRHVDVLQS